jgi:hypothetical protein
MYTGILDVDRAWITLASDPSGASVICGTKQVSATGAPIDGEVIHYAGKRAQAAVYDQDDRAPHYTLSHLSWDQLQQILLWRGQVVLFRTVDGGRVFGVYFDCPYTRSLFTTPPDGTEGTTTFDAEVQFYSVTYNEEV